MSRAMEFIDVVKRLETKGNPSAEREFIDINASPESDSPCSKLSSHSCLSKDEPMHYLCQVKPQTMKQLLWLREFCEEIKAASSGNAEVIELFRQRTGTRLSPADYHQHHVAGKSPDHQTQCRFLLKPSAVRGAGCASPATTPSKQPSTQLTIFYNNTVNVYDVSADQAQAIMNWLADDGNAHQMDPSTKFGELGASTTTPGYSNRLSKATGQNELLTNIPMPDQTPKAERRKYTETLRRANLSLPLARKQSLERFLQRRQIRLSCVAPYTIRATSANKVVDSKLGAPRTLETQNWSTRSFATNDVTR